MCLIGVLLMRICGYKNEPRVGRGHDGSRYRVHLPEVPSVGGVLCSGNEQC